MVAKRIGNCRVIDEIGQGGMAIVYRAVQESLDRPVAIKELKPEFARDQQITERFLREALSVASLQHENIVHVYDYLTRGSAQFIIMEYVEGHNLFELLTMAQRLPTDVAAIIALQLARALEYAHFRGVVHRDIKPSNIVVSKLGEVKLMDFGIARAEALGDMTRPGVALGTPSYMSPEQIMGERVDWRSDLFSFGIVLYQMLSGRKPFLEDENRTVMQAILKDAYPALGSSGADVPRALAKIIARCLKKNPQQRYSSSEELRIALEHFVARRVKMNFRGRLVAFLHNQGLLSEDEALAVVTRDILVESSLSRPVGIIPARWRRRLLFASVATLLVALTVAAGSTVRQWWPRSAGVTGQQQGAPQSYLHLNVWPWARVFVDGVYIDTTPFARAIALAPGRHIIELRNEYFEEERRAVNLEADRTLSLAIELSRRKGTHQ